MPIAFAALSGMPTGALSTGSSWTAGTDTAAEIEMRGTARRTVVVNGDQSVDAPERLSAALRSLPTGGELVLDLTAAADLQAVVLAQLVSHLRARCDPLSVRILGLRQHDHRLLRYLGLDLDPAGCAVMDPRTGGARTSG